MKSQNRSFLSRENGSSSERVPPVREATSEDGGQEVRHDDEAGTDALESSMPPVRVFAAESIEERVEVVPEHSLPVRAWLFACSCLEWLFGFAALIIALALLAAVPLVQFLSLGYLLEASGRIVRTGRIREGFVGIRTMARVGSIVLGTWLVLWPLRLMSDMWYSAQLIAPASGPSLVLRVLLLVLTSLFILHVLLSWSCGGKLRHFFWPLLAPLFFGMWLLRRAIASKAVRPIIRPLAGAISPRLLRDLTTVPPLADWFPPAIFLAEWRRGAMYARARDTVWDFFTSLRLPYYFWLGARGFVGAVAWLFVPALLMIGMTRLPALVTEAGVNLAAVRFVTAIAGLCGFAGTVLMAVVLLYLPFLQTHFACENRLVAMFDLGAVRKMFRRAPIAFWFAFLVTLLFALPLYLLKIEYVATELIGVFNILFVLLIFPARLLTGWAVARAKKREASRHYLVRVFARVAEIPVVGFYVFVLFFTQYISWDGAWSLLEQHPVLLPVPFFGL